MEERSERRRSAVEATMKILRDESGQTLILVALALTCVLGLVGVATDVGLLFHFKRNLQIAADSAAVAGALQLKLNSANVSSAAMAAAAKNGISSGLIVNNPPSSGPHSTSAAYVEVIITQSEPLFFAKVLGLTSISVAARAVATNGASNGCMYTLGTSGTGILMNGTVDLSAASCSIIDDSSNGSSALLANGTVTLAAKSIGVVGGVTNNGGNSITPTPVTGIVPVSNPLSFLTPPANPGGCTSALFNGSGGTLSQGCYSGITINGSNIVVTLSTGTYFITGSFIVNGSNVTVNGTGVTIYLASSSASFTDNGNTTLNLSAPTSGALNGILFYQNPSDTNTLTINGSSTSSLKGIFYAPTANLVVNGSGSTDFYTAFVVGSLIFNGTGTLLDYASINAASPLTSTTLVE
jgi:Flp pilus assembly protein TadG